MALLGCWGLALLRNALSGFDLFVRASRALKGIEGSSPKAVAKGLPCGIVWVMAAGRVGWPCSISWAFGPCMRSSTAWCAVSRCFIQVWVPETLPARSAARSRRAAPLACWAAWVTLRLRARGAAHSHRERWAARALRDGHIFGPSGGLCVLRVLLRPLGLCPRAAWLRAGARRPLRTCCCCYCCCIARQRQCGTGRHGCIALIQQVGGEGGCQKSRYHEPPASTRM